MPIVAIAVPLPSEPALPDWKPSRPPNPPSPANDNFPFRPRKLGSFGRAVGRASPIGRLSNAYDLGYAIGTGISTLLNTYQVRQRKLAIHRTHYLFIKCRVPVTGGPYRNQAVGCGQVNYFSNETNLQNSLGTNFSPHITSHNVFYVNIVRPLGGWHAAKRLAEYWKPRSGANPSWGLAPISPVFVTGMPDIPFIGDPVDPNQLRGAPASVPEPSPVPPPQPAPPQWRYSSDGQPSTRPHRRRQPPRREKETKSLSRSAKLGIGLYKALDYASEKAEIVDAIFKALPKDVQRRWSKGRGTIGENFGQYGTAGADWKLQALWHNWHRVDAEQAVRNILKNFVEDAMIGATQKHLPRNVVKAFERELLFDEQHNRQGMSPEQIMSEWVDSFFNEVW